MVEAWHEGPELFNVIKVRDSELIRAGYREEKDKYQVNLRRINTQRGPIQPFKHTQTPRSHSECNHFSQTQTYFGHKNTLLIYSLHIPNLLKSAVSPAGLSCNSPRPDKAHNVESSFTYTHYYTHTHLDTDKTMSTKEVGPSGL